MQEFVDSPVFRTIAEAGNALNLDTYVIGGYVRDAILKRDNKDIDIVCVGDGIALAKEVAKRLGDRKVNVFKNFGTAHILYNDFDIEFVGTRKESYRSDSRKPDVEPGTVEDDQLRRDFTINALAISLNDENFGELIDPFGGVVHLDQKMIKTPREPEQTYIDDPLRMLRAIRFASQLGFEIEDRSFKAIEQNKERLEILSQERITTELNKIIESPVPSVGFKLLDEAGVLDYILPELGEMKGVEVIDGFAHKDNFYHTLKVLDNISTRTDNVWLRWAAILHDIAKPATKRFQEGHGWTFHGHEDKGAKMVPNIFKRLKLPLDSKMKYVQKLVRLHLRPIALVQDTVSDSAVRRLLYEAGDDIDDLMKLCEADITSKNEQKVKRYLRNFKLVKQKMQEVEEKDRLRNWQPPIDGDEIMRIFNLGPSREIGILKNAIKEAILDGEIRNDKQEATTFMFELAAKMGLKPVKQEE